MDAGLRRYQTVAQNAARDLLITSNLNFVKHILSRIIVNFPSHVDRENLEAAGVLGLVEAANRYSHRRGVNFKTFAYQRIRGAILDELRRNCPLPQHILKHWKMIKAAIQQNAGALTSEQIAELTELSIDEIEDCMSAMRMVAPQMWRAELAELVPDQLSSVTELQEQEQKTILANAIEQLPERLRAVVTLYYGNELTLKQIGLTLQISESRVSRILARAEVQLKFTVQQMQSSGDPISENVNSFNSTE